MQEPSIAALSSPSSTLVFDYFVFDAFDPAKASPRMQRMQAAAEFSGERMLTGLDPRTLSMELGAVGHRLSEQLNPMQIQARSFDGNGSGYRMVEHVHIATVGVS